MYFSHEKLDVYVASREALLLGSELERARDLARFGASLPEATSAIGARTSARLRDQEHGALRRALHLIFEIAVPTRKRASDLVDEQERLHRDLVAIEFFMIE